MTDAPDKPLAEALQAITGAEPPAYVGPGIYAGFQLTDRQQYELQSWCVNHARPDWSTGIGLLEAAEHMVEVAVENGNIAEGPERPQPPRPRPTEATEAFLVWADIIQRAADEATDPRSKAETAAVAAANRAYGCGQTLREWVASCSPSPAMSLEAAALVKLDALLARFGDVPLPTDKRIPAPKPGAVAKAVGAMMRAPRRSIPTDELLDAIDAIRAGDLPGCDPWDGWTRIEDGLPPECAEGGQSDHVLVWQETPPGMRPLMTVPGIEVYVHTRGSWADWVPYTHWRPLPKPPQTPAVLRDSVIVHDEFGRVSAFTDGLAEGFRGSSPGTDAVTCEFTHPDGAKRTLQAEDIAILRGAIDGSIHVRGARRVADNLASLGLLDLEAEFETEGTATYALTALGVRVLEAIERTTGQ